MVLCSVSCVNSGRPPTSLPSALNFEVRIEWLKYHGRIQKGEA
jgi:hypothetical protein